ncbi:D-alanyl-D-alanine carboxypeptidase/D-alanyl-D-alanine-endopeptidase [candidate division WOR-3 bacterium]|nr:D-alanyl-D-alanine carboxypeptidase/D-alanyl-D-alanine-endopeptidase [candidate division WOR-3 bacterium]
MRRAIILVIFLFLSHSSRLVGAPTSIINAVFQKKLNQILQDPVLKPATIGIEIVETKDKKVLYSKNAGKLFVPASGAKIIISLAALSLLKPEYQFKTEIFFDSRNLYIKGYGDPSLQTKDLQEIADKIIEKGIKKIENIICDDSYFDSQEIGEGWVEEPEAFGFNARISALSLNNNCVRIFIKPAEKSGKEVKFILYPKTNFVGVINDARTGYKDSLRVERKLISSRNYLVLKGEISKESSGKTFVRHIENPALHTAIAFKKVLETRGIKVKGKISKRELSDSLKPIYTHYSRPLVHLIYEMNKESINFYADQILKTLGAELLEPPGSFEKGGLKLQEFLKGIGLGENEFRIYDGSGLSRYDLISPQGIVKVLLYGLSDPEIRPEFLSSLPTAGIDGTLERRLRGSSSARKVRAKTGTMRSISSLSGYTLTEKGNLIIFSIMMNNYTTSASLIRKIQDNIVELIITEL